MILLGSGTFVNNRKRMDIKGFEPLTFSMQSRRSTTDLNALFTRQKNDMYVVCNYVLRGHGMKIKYTQIPDLTRLQEEKRVISRSITILIHRGGEHIRHQG